ncbi:MAG TPA: hypothetical protein VH478_25635 [Trebonia sp.]|nr:hypothetical protein [Trebonia sp.]
MPEKVTISHRGARYEIGMGKRYYAIWAIDAPRSEPVDRWPETPEGWSQAWARFTAIETPGTVAAVPRKRPLAGLLAAGGRAGARAGGSGGLTSRAAGARPVAIGALGLGIALSIAGLFPDYFTGQALTSSSDQLVPHVLYMAGWAVALVLILSGGPRLRIGGLLGAGLSAVTLGLFVSDLATGLSAGGGVGAGMIVSLIGWLACSVGCAAALLVRPVAARPAEPGTLSMAPSAADGAPDAVPAVPEAAPAAPGAGTVAAPGPNAGLDSSAAPGLAARLGPPSGIEDPRAMPAQSGMGIPPLGASAGDLSGNTAPAATGPVPLGYGVAGGNATVAMQGAPATYATTSAASRRAFARPRKADAGPITLLALCAIGAALTFLPSWDSYTLTQASTGNSQTQTMGNAFQNPGWVTFGDVITVVALVVVAVLAALWRPARHGSALLAGAIIPVVAQAISALLQVSQPASPEFFGITPAQAQGAGLTVNSGLTSIFWVYVVFLVALVISAAWLATTPSAPAGGFGIPGTAESANPESANPVPGYLGHDDPAAASATAPPPAAESGDVTRLTGVTGPEADTAGGAGITPEVVTRDVTGPEAGAARESVSEPQVAEREHSLTDDAPPSTGHGAASFPGSEGSSAGSGVSAG